MTNTNIKTAVQTLSVFNIGSQQLAGLDRTGRFETNKILFKAHPMLSNLQRLQFRIKGGAVHMLVVVPLTMHRVKRLTIERILKCMLDIVGNRLSRPIGGLDIRTI